MSYNVLCRHWETLSNLEVVSANVTLLRGMKDGGPLTANDAIHLPPSCPPSFFDRTLPLLMGSIVAGETFDWPGQPVMHPVWKQLPLLLGHPPILADEKMSVSRETHEPGLPTP